MNFIASSEQCVRSREFDEFVAAADEYLRLPRVQAKLGGLADMLIKINSEAFLPNYRHGEITTPRSVRSLARVALLPVSSSEAEAIYPALNNYTYTEEPQVHPWSEMYTAEHYGIEKSYIDLVELWAARSNVTRRSKFSGKQGLRRHAEAHTQSKIHPTPDGAWILSRPSVVAKYDLDYDNPTIKGARVAHEHLHAHDIMSDGPLNLLFDFAVASEVRAYSVHAAHLRDEDILDDPKDQASLIESARLKYGDPDSPYKLTPELQDEVLQIGI